MVEHIQISRYSRTGQVIAEHECLSQPIELGRDYPVGTARALNAFAQKNFRIIKNRAGLLSLAFGYQVIDLQSKALGVRGVSLISDRLKRQIPAFQQ